jgi:spore cortex formation protein SpoVR/YcgB (stage V sporulation)
MSLQHNMVGRRPLNGEEAIKVLEHLSFLWGYDVYLDSVDENENVRASFAIKDGQTLLDVFLDDDNG